MRKSLFFLLMCVLGSFGIVKAQDVVTIDGTIGGWEQSEVNYVPIYNNYEYAVTQQYYTAEEIGKSSGTIQSISFKTSDDDVYSYTRTFDVYMVNTDNYHFGVGGKTMEQVSSTDLVFSGTVEFTKDAWITLELDTEFEYTGSNLLVCVNDYTGQYVPTGSYFKAYISTYELPYQGDTGLARRSLYKKSTSASFDPTASAIAGCALSQYVPYVQLGFAAGSQEYLEPAVPANVVATAHPVSSSITLTWDAAENAQSYKVFNGTELLVEELVETNYTVSDLTEGTEYCFSVVSVNGPKVSAASEPACATTRAMESLLINPGDATTTQAPFGNGSRYTWTEMLYKSEEIGKACNIERLAFCYSYGSAMTLSEVNIYMAETEKSTFETNTSWTAEEDLTLVYSGTNVVIGDSGWETFELDMPFVYGGEKNLAIVVAKSSETVNFQLFWVCEEIENSILLTASDDNPADAEYPAADGHLYKTRPNIKFLYSNDPIPVTPEAPVVAATAKGATSIELTWESVAYATSYNVYNGTEKIANVTETTYAVEGLTAGTEYCFTVTSVNGELESAASEAACATTIPAAPANVVATAQSTSEIALSWNAVEGATNYYVYQNGEKVTDVTEMTYKATGLEYNTEYCFQVTAVNEAGESEKSAEVCAKTLGESISENANGFNIYPNPVNDKLYIETEMTVEEVSVYDMFGRQQTIDYGQQTIDVTELNSGIYFVKVRTDNGETVKRFIKK